MDCGHRISRQNHDEAAPSTEMEPGRPATAVRHVWRSNVWSELEIMTTYLRHSHRFVAIDTGFPRFLRSTPRDASEEECYGDLKFNVDRTHLNHLGVTLLDDAGEMPWPGCHWQINFCNFRPDVDAHSQDSVDFLRRSGRNLRKCQREGVSAPCFSPLLRNKIFNPRLKAKFITFHGLYDVAYVVKLITGAPLPETSTEFVLLARRLLGDFCDLKHMARFYPGLRRGELSLMKLANIVLGDKKPPGIWHQAGYDSLLTGAVYHQMKKTYNIDDHDEERFGSVLYGLEEGCAESKMMEVTTPPPLLLPHPPPHHLLPCPGFPTAFQVPPPHGLAPAHSVRAQFFGCGFLVCVPALQPCPVQAAPSTCRFF